MNRIRSSRPPRDQGDAHHLAEWLSRFRCFYYNDEDVLGPVTLWQVREMIDADLLSPDVQVIIEGTDSWYSYVEMEQRTNIHDVPSGIPKLACYYFFREHVYGPMSLSAIFYYIRLGKLPSDVPVCQAGTEDWKCAADFLRSENP